MNQMNLGAYLMQNPQLRQALLGNSSTRPSPIAGPTPLPAPAPVPIQQGNLGQYNGASPDRRITMPVPVQGPVVPKPTAMIQNPDNGSSLLAALKTNSTGPRVLRANAPSMVKNFGLE